MSWEEAGVAWGYRAKDWAYLMEPLFAPLYAQLAHSSSITEGTRVLDAACGAGAGLATYRRAGAVVSGVDASEALLAIAAARVPSADLHHRSMSELPWSDGSFDVVTGVNAFVYADDGGLAEAHRVLAPNGVLAIGFFLDPGDIGPCMQELGAALEGLVDDEDTHTPLKMADADVTRALLDAAGFEVVGGGEVIGTSEFPDVDTAYRGLAATGNMFPVTEAGREPALRERCEPLLQSLWDEDLGVRMQATFGWVTARAV
jgi:SAM-dependent methyltransferase